jgi:hypothetical protein
MPRYEKAPAEIGQIVERMMDRYHPQLRDAKVTLAMLMAFPTKDKNGDTTGPALTHNGYPAAAVVKIIGLKERTDGRADAELVIDGDNWPLLSEAQRDALVDHELEHLELKTDKDGLLVRDDLERPKLVIRKHDHQFGWFDAIVRRHGRDSLEFKQFEEFQTAKYTQNWLPYLDDPDKTPVLSDPLKEAGAVNHEPAAHEGLTSGDSDQDAFVAEVGREFNRMGILANPEALPHSNGKAKHKPAKRAFAGKPAKKSKGRKLASSR